jgi:predicted DNA-binding protein (MmcQ/YjbR family)
MSGISSGTPAPAAANGENGGVDLAELADRIRSLALSFPETYEDEPWGHPVFKVGSNRMFVSMRIGDRAVNVTVKLTPEEREMAQLLPYVRRAAYVGRYGWVTAEVSDEESLASALDWVRESYWLKAPAELRGAVEAQDGEF